MASRRCLQTLTRHYPSLFSSRTSLPTLTTRQSLHILSSHNLHPLDPPTLNPHHLPHNLKTPFPNSIRRFSLRSRLFGNGKDKDEEESAAATAEDEEEDDDDEDHEEEVDELSESEEEGIDGDGWVSNVNISRTYSLEEKEEEAAAIGYKVIGPLCPTERPFKWREPVFAIVQIGSHQFKVSNGDYIYTEKLKFCEVNDKLLLNRVLILGSATQTIIGRPTLPEASVHAVVEEHALDAKVLIFKKKRRKNYRRNKGHRQELTRLRITDIQGIQKPEKVEKPEKLNKSERVAKAEREAIAA